MYLNGHWLAEAAKQEDVFNAVETDPLWFAVVDDTNTTIWAQFKGADPNEEEVEINVRQSVFYPEEPGKELHYRAWFHFGARGHAMGTANRRADRPDRYALVKGLDH